MCEIKVSIIVPVYNVEKYIIRCITSIAAQTFTEIEAIFVDDCGTDRSIELIEQFIGQYTGNVVFRIIRLKSNKGQSAARNRGIRESHGKYIYFLDSDDYISPDCIDVLYSVAVKDSSLQMVMGDYQINGSLYLAPMMMEQRTYVSEEIIDAQFSHNIYTMPWNKLVLKTFITDNDLFFQEGIIHEDNLWSYCMALCIDRIAVVRKKTYHYVIHSHSTERSNTKEFHEEQLFKVLVHLIDFIFSDRITTRHNIRNNLAVCRFVQNEIRKMLIGPEKDGNTEKSWSRYKQLKKKKMWSMKEVCGMPHLMISEKINMSHFLLPAFMGYKMYMYMNRNKYSRSNEIETMKLTIITINYNNLNGLRRTLPSIMSQTYTGYELIVVDGGSTDGSKEYIQSQDRINHWVSEPDNGVYNAMNKGVKMAHGEYCIFMNSGDMFFSPLALEEAVPMLCDADFYTGSSVFIEEEKAYPCIPPDVITMDFMMHNALNHQSTFTRTDILKKHPFNENHKIVSDWELFFEEWHINKCSYKRIPTKVSVYFMDGISSLNKEQAECERIEVAERILGKDSVKRLLNGYCEDPEEKQRRIKNEQIKNKLQNKLNRAMTYTPVSRDLKIIRNGFKFLLKDLFV